MADVGDVGDVGDVVAGVGSGAFGNEGESVAVAATDDGELPCLGAWTWVWVRV